MTIEKILFEFIKHSLGLKEDEDIKSLDISLEEIDSVMNLAKRHSIVPLIIYSLKKAF